MRDPSSGTGPGASPHGAERTSVTVAEARDIMLGSIQPLGAETVGLEHACGRALAEAVVSGRTIPPRDNSAMDGYAVRAEDTTRVPATLRVVETIPAGSQATRAIGPGEAMRIFTGAPIPSGANAVVMQEHTELTDTQVLVLKPAKSGDHVRPAGSDVVPETAIGEPGDPLHPALVGMLAAIGRTQIRVVRRPRVAIIATGDELVEPDRLVDDGKIGNSNSYGLHAAVAEAGAEPIYLGIAPDRPEALRQVFSEALRFDAVISTGGVSVGEYDWIKQVLADLGGKLRLWRVRMKPGAPLAFVMVGDVPVFGLPGNPVSTLVSFEQFVRPSLLRMMGRRELFRPIEAAILAEDFDKSAGRLHFVRVLIRRRDGKRYAFVGGDQSSGILLSMVRAHGLMIAPEEATHIAAGTEVAVQMLDRTDMRRTPGF